MKKILYIFSAAILAFACTKELVKPVEPIIIDDETDGPKVTIEFSLPPVTKGTMAHDPTIGTIHVAVFNQAGVLKQYEKATLTNPDNLTNNNNSSGNPKYAVEINMSAKPRILHFIADSPIDTYDALIAAAGTSGEDVILNALTTSDGNTAYWQRIELDRIDAYTYQGGVYNVPGGGSFGTANGNSYTYTEAGQTITVYEGDYIKVNGHKILDGTGYFQSDYVKGRIANIAFVRNFAEVTVSSTTGGSSNFVPKKFALVNVPKAGYVAPYDNDKGEFCSAYTELDASVVNFAHDDIADSDYPGSLVGSIDTAKPTSYIDLTSANNDAYMYERPIPNASQPATCIIVGGVFTPDGGATPPKDNDGNTWFKIELAKDDGSYFPIYRGISYDILIGAISGTLGYASPDEAYNHLPVGDISGSVTTKTLTQINDGKGTTLWVEYVDYVATSDETKTIYYTMYYQATAGATPQYLNNTISFNASSITHADANYKAILGSVNVDSGTYSDGTPDPTKQWKMASVTLAEPGTTTKHSTLRIQGKSHANHDMFRDVDYRVMGTQHFQNGEDVLKGTALPSEDEGEQTTLTIYLPNDLGMSMFPLTLKIEAENGGFTTVDGLPVESGPSLFNTSTSSRNAFYFLKTIEYEDYYNAETGNTTTAFTARFKTTRDGTTTAAGTNATNFRVLDKVKTGRTTPYFDVAECYVAASGDPSFTIYYNGSASNGVSINADVTTVNFNLRSTGGNNTEWTIEYSDNVTSVTPTSGHGYATVTVTIPENTSTTATETYTVTAKRTGFDDQVFTITQQPAIPLEPITRTVNTTSSTFNTSYVYTGDYASELSISFTGGQNRGSTYIDLNNRASSVSISANTITSIVITWYSTTYAATEANTTITSGGGSIAYSTSGSYPTTTWTGSSDSVTLSFARNGNTEFTTRSIVVTYLHEAE